MLSLLPVDTNTLPSPGFTTSVVVIPVIDTVPPVESYNTIELEPEKYVPPVIKTDKSGTSTHPLLFDNIVTCASSVVAVKVSKETTPLPEYGNNLNNLSSSMT